jgi:hypothetical protein
MINLSEGFGEDDRRLELAQGHAQRWASLLTVLNLGVIPPEIQLWFTFLKAHIFLKHFIRI